MWFETVYAEERMNFHCTLCSALYAPKLQDWTHKRAFVVSPCHTVKVKVTFQLLSVSEEISEGGKDVLELGALRLDIGLSKSHPPVDNCRQVCTCYASRRGDYKVLGVGVSPHQSDPKPKTPSFHAETA